MGALLRRLVVLVNNTKQVVELKVSRRSAPPGFYPYTIKLAPFDVQEIPATIFHRGAVDASRPTVIKIFVGSVYSNEVLTPQDFIQYRRITFRVDDNGNVKVNGVRATGLIDQLCRIRLVSSLLRAMRFIIGDHEHGDEVQEEEII